MLIKAPQSEARVSSVPGELEMVSLAGVPFVQEWRARDAAVGLFRLLDEAHTADVMTWVNASPAREVVHTEVDPAIWVWLPSQRRRAVPPTPVRPVAPVLVPPPAVVFPLEDHKRNRKTLVDDKTDALIAAGFTVDGKVFSASDAAQLKWLGMFTSRASLSYPVTVPTIDDTEFVSLVTATDVETYYNALLARIQTVLTGGVLLKGQIAAAATKAELDAIVDNRT